jgi:hypothetical protein
MQEETSSAPTAGFAESFGRKYQYLMDKSSPHILYRWIGFTLLLTIYFIRVYYANGWFIVTYGLGIYMLNQLIGFISPQVRSRDDLALHVITTFQPVVCSLTPRTIWILDCQRETMRSSGITSSIVLHYARRVTLSRFIDMRRPFARRLPEFKFWHSCTRSVLTALCMTFFSIFDVPVFWPILLLYFIVLFVITMKRQIKHMLKHKYVPFSWGKTTYAGAGASTGKAAGKN